MFMGNNRFKRINAEKNTCTQNCYQEYQNLIIETEKNWVYLENKVMKGITIFMKEMKHFQNTSKYMYLNKCTLNEHKAKSSFSRSKH